MHEITKQDIDYAHKTARRYMLKGYDDQIVSAAYEGLLDAAKTYDNSTLFLTWAFTKIRQHAIQEHRKLYGRNNKRHFEEITENTVKTNNDTEIFEEIDYYQKFMDTLNPKQRKRFYWYKFYGCGPRRMATYSEEKESAISQSLKLIKIKFNKFNADNM